MRIQVGKIFKFEAAHNLPEHKGSCKNLHGHSYKLEVVISGRVKEQGEESGMIMDFSVLKTIVNTKIIDVLDHSYLNNLFENPTAEYMVEWIADQIKRGTKEDDHRFVLQRVRLWETDTSYAEWILC